MSATLGFTPAIAVSADQKAEYLALRERQPGPPEKRSCLLPDRACR